MTETLLAPPASETFGYVTATVMRSRGDTVADGDDTPDYIPQPGAVTFTPARSWDALTDALVVRDTVTSIIDPATGQLTMAGVVGPVKLWVGEWTASFALDSEPGEPVRVIPPITFTLTVDHTFGSPLKLSAAAPVTPPATTILQALAVPALVEGNVLTVVGGQLAWTTGWGTGLDANVAGYINSASATQTAGDSRWVKRDPVAVLFGDSWTQTESYALRDALSAALGMPVVSYGIGGAKFIASGDPASFWQELDTAAADTSVDKATVRHVIFVGGMNNWAWHSGANDTEAAGIFAQLRTMYPATATFGYYADLPYRWRDGNTYRDGWEYFRAYQQAAIDNGFSSPQWPYSWSHGSLVANASDWRYPGNSLWFGGGVGDFLNSYVHPTAAGFQLFGKLIAQDIAGNHDTQHLNKLIVSGTGISTFLQVGSGLQYSYLTGLVKQSGNRFQVRALLDFQLVSGGTIPDYWLRINQSIAPRVFFESGSAFSQYVPLTLVNTSDNTSIQTIGKLSLTVVPEADQSDINNFYVDLKTPNLPTLSVTPTQYRMIVNLDLDRM